MTFRQALADAGRCFWRNLTDACRAFRKDASSAARDMASDFGVRPIPTNHLRHLLDGEPLDTNSKGSGASA